MSLKFHVFSLVLVRDGPTPVWSYILEIQLQILGSCRRQQPAQARCGLWIKILHILFMERTTYTGRN